MSSRVFELTTATDQEEAHIRQLLDLASVNDINELNWRLNNLQSILSSINQVATLAHQDAAMAKSSVTLAVEKSTEAVNKLNAFEAAIANANYVADFRDTLLNGSPP